MAERKEGLQDCSANLNSILLGYNFESSASSSVHCAGLFLTFEFVDEILNFDHSHKSY